MPGEHGTANMYNNYGCRCEPCTKAWNVYHKAWRWRNGVVPMDISVAERHAKAMSRDNHGTETRYTSMKCRCDGCRIAASEARRRRRLRGREEI